MNSIEGSAPLDASSQPVGQSFTPSLSSLDFVQLRLFYSGAFNFTGATMLVNIRAGSLAGTILGSSSAVFIPGDFFGITNFVFSTSVPLTSSVTYYLQPVIQSGGAVSSYVTDGSYLGGTVIFQGTPVLDRDLWFREGIIVPEPSSLSLVLLSFGLLFTVRRRVTKEEKVIQ